MVFIGSFFRYYFEKWKNQMKISQTNLLLSSGDRVLSLNAKRKKSVVRNLKRLNAANPAREENKEVILIKTTSFPN
jgi:hypothetical protein